MPKYDVPKAGNNHPLTMRDGKIVAMMGWQGLTIDQVALLPEAPMQEFFVRNDGEELKVYGVNARDAAEAISRYHPFLGGSTINGEVKMYRKVEQPVDLKEESPPTA
jgi:hypothetical protein